MQSLYTKGLNLGVLFFLQVHFMALGVVDTPPPYAFTLQCMYSES